ncbi:hypothetical protein ACMGDM_07980 [Sphingomonas sp. DT-51]|uniref:hypothetical protein n=1 Tax=Sphingomonas sp. DT-51 TaxID=3396165 RepID=UPI003F1CB7E7
MMRRGLTRRTGLMAFLGWAAAWRTTPATASAPSGEATPHAAAAASATVPASGEDHTEAFARLLRDTSAVTLSPGSFRVGVIGGTQYQRALHVSGAGAPTVLLLTDTDRAAFSVGAVGGEFGDVRAQTIFELLTFKPGAAAPARYTALDLRATHPYLIRDIVAIGLGPGAIQLTSCYYGAIERVSLANSGLSLKDVNNLSLSRSDVRPDEFHDSSRGEDLFARAGAYPLDLEDCAKTSFVSTVIEGWKTPVLRLRRSPDTIFSSCWFEGLISPGHVMLVEDTRRVDFIDSRLDFSIPFPGSFIHVAAAPGKRRSGTELRIRGGSLTMTSIPFGDAGLLVTAADDVPVRLIVEDVTFGGGPLLAGPGVEIELRSLTLSGPRRHYLSSRAMARIDCGTNSWMPASRNTDPDFSANRFETSAPGVTVTRSLAASDRTSGATATVIEDGGPRGPKQIRYRPSADLPAVVSATQSYVVFARVMAPTGLDLVVELNGGAADFAAAPRLTLIAGRWTDILFKTDEDVTWAQGRRRPPEIVFTLDRGTRARARLCIDRLDFALVDGDFPITG